MLAEESLNLNLRKLYGKPFRRRSGRDRDRTVERRQKIMHTVNNLSRVENASRYRLPMVSRNPLGKGASNLA